MMARGAAQQQNLLNTKAGTSFNNAQSIYGNLTKDYNGILAQPGYTKDQINTQMNAAETPIAGQIASAKQALTNRSAATGNTAGMVSGQRDLARTGAQLGSQAAWGVQSNADNVALSERDKALQGMNSLYAPSLSSAGGLYGQATTAMEARPSVLQDIQQGANIFRTLIPAPKS
jgi:hypothetical protein